MGRTGQEWREGERRVGEIREGERMGWERGSSSFALGKKGVGVYNRNCDKSIYNCYS